jgi:hypothetical protein
VTTTKRYTMRRGDGETVRVTVPDDDHETEARLEAFDLMRDALRALLETDLFDTGNHARARAALAAADAAVRGDQP